MTVNSLASTFNIGAVALVVAMSFIVSRSCSMAFFESWLKAYVAALFVLLSTFLPVDGHPFLGIFMLLFDSLLAGFFFQTAFQIEGRGPQRSVWIFLGAMFAGCIILVAMGLPPKKVFLLPFLCSCAASFRLAFLFFFKETLFNRMASALWLGFPLILVFSSALFYPFIPSDFLWIGFSAATVLHLLVGTGMIVFLLEKNQGEIRRLNERQLSLQQERIDALHESERMKDELLAVVSHEMRTPLNAIQGFAGILKQEMVGPINERQHQSLARILGGAQRLLELVNNMLDAARIQGDKLVICPSPCRYFDLLQEIVDCFEPIRQENGLELELESELPGSVSCDRERMAQVLANLLSNAMKFTPKGGKVSVKAFVEADRLVTEVKDTGIGIAAEFLPEIFAPFKQADMTATREYGGTGLGLHIAKSIVELHGGSLDVQSEKGAGSTFRFWLPL